MPKDAKTDSARQQDLAGKAMELKNAAPAPRHPSPGRSAHDGMAARANTKIAPSGAFDAEGHRPVLERSRKVR